MSDFYSNQSDDEQIEIKLIDLEKKMNKAIKSYNKKLRKYKGETPAQTSSSN